MSQTKNIIIFGGTGVIGKYITSAILASKESFDRVALFTSASTVSNKKEQLEGWKHQGLDIIVGDLTKEKDVLSAYKSFDTVVSAVGRNVIAEQINLIKLAEATPSITRFFPSEYGTDIEYNPQTSPREKPHQLKLKVRKYIREEVRRLDVTFLVTGPYADLYLGKSNNAEYGSFDTKAKKATLLGSGEDPVSFTTMKDVGKLLVAALKHPEESKNKALKVNSFTATPNEILAELEKQTGGQKWDVEYTSLAKLTELEKKAWEEGNPAATVYTLRRIWTEGGTLYEKRDNALIDAEETDSLAQAIAQVLHNHA